MTAIGVGSGSRRRVGSDEAGEDHVESGRESLVAVAGVDGDEVIGVGGPTVASIGDLLQQRIPFIAGLEFESDHVLSSTRVGSAVPAHLGMGTSDVEGLKPGKSVVICGPTTAHESR
jgi:hypothetical protein